LAQTYLVWRHMDWFMRACQRRYGAIFTVRALPWRRIVMVCDPDVIKTIFTGDPEIWRAGESYRLLAPVLGERSVMVLDGAEHLRTRKRLLPPFHGDAIRRYEEVIETIAAEEVARWPVGEPISLVEAMRRITLEVILRAVIGTEGGARLAEMRAALLHLVDVNPLLVLTPLWAPLQRVGPGRDFKQRLQNAKSLLLEEVARRRADPQVAQRTDVLSLLVCSGELSDAELLDQLTTLLIAGHDTSTSALAWTLERLVRHPLELEHAREDDEYLDAVIKEVLRLRPVLPAVARHTARPVTLAGYRLPAGVTVMPGIRLVHLDAELFPDPENFRPERFLEGQGSNYGWIPYGGGTRRCLGASFASLQLRVVLRTVLVRAELRAEVLEDEPIQSRFITLVPGRGARVIQTRRLQAHSL
jgi:cytochrome P450